ncbi:hypothetical protein RIdsm_03147 [Roseovarius indicus]|uniref:Lipoprotein n=1 Tax=Roseovarius indicus TaxID=540747 RepID=A0A5P3AGG5_9RHOB|nr:hypothetical protein RIdsm_03147 [Roseovarius indicus]
MFKTLAVIVALMGGVLTANTAAACILCPPVAER